MDNNLNKRILIFAPKKFPTDHSFLENVFMRRFPKLGFEVYFVFNGVRFVFPWRIDRWGEAAVFVRSAVKGGALLQRIINYVLIRLNYLLIPFIMLKVKPKFIFVRTELLTCISAIIYAKLRGNVRVYYHYNWPFYEKKILQNILLSKIFKKCDHIFTISSAMAEKLIAERRVKEKKASPLPLAANAVDDLSFSKRQLIRSELGLGNLFVTIYIGSLQKIREPEIHIHTAYYLKELIGEDFHLLIIGAETKAEKQYLAELSRKLQVSRNVTILERLSRENVTNYLFCADVGFSPIPLKPYFEISSPTKIYEYMAAGLPFVSSKISEVVSILEKAKAGLLADHDAKSYAFAINTLYRNKDLRQKCGKEGLRFTKKVHNYDILAGELAKMIK